MSWTRFCTAMVLCAAIVFYPVPFHFAGAQGEDSQGTSEAMVAPEDQGSSDAPASYESQAAPAETASPASSTFSPAGERIPGGMEGNVSLDLRNIDIIEALKYLAVKAGANIIATKNVSGRVTLMVEQVPVKDIFDIMLRSNGLAYVKQGTIYNVMTEEEYKAIFGKRFSDLRQVKVFKLQYAIPDQAFSMLDALKSEIGRVLVEPDSGTVLLMDTPDRIAEIEKAIGTLEQKNIVKVFDLKYAKAKEVEEQLKSQLDAKKVGTVKADERSNQVIIQALPDRMPDIERLIAALDGKTREVLIDTQIIKIKLQDKLDQGVDWQGLIDVGKAAGMIYMGSTPFSVLQTATTGVAQAMPSRFNFLTGDSNLGATANFDANGVGGGTSFTGNSATNIGTGATVKPGQVMHVGVVGQKRDLDFAFKYMQTIGNSQVLSSPKLAVINNQEARIHVGERQAYVTTTTTTGQTTNTVSEEVTFVDVGIQLSVTPTINSDGFITMKIKPEISSVVSFLTTPSGNKIPIIDTSMAETTVMVKDGSTIVIGGLRKEEKSKDFDQVPWLGKIPLLGYFFKTGNNQTIRTELLIMMTPRIIKGEVLTTGDEMDFEYKPARNYKKYKALTGEKDLQHVEKPPTELIKPYKEYGMPPAVSPVQ